MGRIATAFEDHTVLAHFEEERRKQWRNIPTCYPNHYSDDDIAEFEQAFAASNKRTEDEQAAALRADAAAALLMVRAYQDGGAKTAVLSHLRHLRNKHLAHHDLGRSDSGVPAEAKNDAAVENFYQDMSRVIRMILSVVQNTDYRPEDTAELRRRHAALFWAGVRGERTEGHPDYMPLRRL